MDEDVGKGDGRKAYSKVGVAVLGSNIWLGLVVGDLGVSVLCNGGETV